MTKAVRWTQDELDAFQKRKAPAAPINTVVAPQIKPKPKRSKYAAEKVTQAGAKFDSKKEARRWAILEQWEKAGVITELRRQVAFELAPAVRLDGEARKKPAIRYVSDFCYIENGVLIVEDCKSPPTRKLPAYRLKRHLMATVLKIQIKEI